MDINESWVLAAAMILRDTQRERLYWVGPTTMGQTAPSGRNAAKRRNRS